MSAHASFSAWLAPQKLGLGPLDGPAPGDSNGNDGGVRGDRLNPQERFGPKLHRSALIITTEYTGGPHLRNSQFLKGKGSDLPLVSYF